MKYFQILDRSDKNFYIWIEVEEDQEIEVINKAMVCHEIHINEGMPDIDLRVKRIK